jgi:DNA-directed RNA polymerase subunit RPC12/RpoP
MKKKAKPSILRHNQKEEIVNWANKGVFNSNPLLSVSHSVRCKACGFSENIIYLNYLKLGRFKLGETQMIEVSYAAPTIFGLSHTVEKITPIIITIKCNKCGSEIFCTPVSVEYLFFTATKQHKMENMYV